MHICNINAYLYFSNKQEANEFFSLLFCWSKNYVLQSSVYVANMYIDVQIPITPHFTYNSRQTKKYGEKANHSDLIGKCVNVKIV